MLLGRLLERALNKGLGQKGCNLYNKVFKVLYWRIRAVQSLMRLFPSGPLYTELRQLKVRVMSRRAPACMLLSGFPVHDLRLAAGK
jgi:hypothetical protein